MKEKNRILSDNMIREYCIWLAENEKSQRTIKKYSYYLSQFQKFTGEERITKEQVLAWKKSLKKHFSPVTVNGALASVNGLFRHNGWKDCTARFLKIRRRIFSPQQKELTREEYERLVITARKCGNDRLALILQTICSTGIRISELSSITVEAVHKKMADVECKGRIRTIFLPEQLCGLLMEYACRNRIQGGMIFVTRTGKPVDRSNIWREMKKLGEKAKVDPDKIFPHNLRHLFARTYYSQEQDLLRLSDILGHSDINTTRIYTMESGENHRKQLEKLGLVVEKAGEYNRISLLLYSKHK